MKFRVDRDVLADAVAWAARSLPVRPSVPVLAGLLIERQRRRAGAVDASTTRPRRGPPSTPTSATRAGPWSAAGCSPTSAAACPTKPVEMALDGARVSLTCGSARFSLQTMPVEDYPTLPGDARRPPAPSRSDVFAHAVAQAVTAAGRDDMLPVLTGVRLEIDGVDDLAAGHRPVPALPARARLGPAHPRRVRWPPWCRPRCSATPPSRSPPAARSRSRCPPAAAGEGLIGFEGSGPGGVRRTTTRLLDGEFPKVRSLFPQRAPDRRHGRQGRADRVGQARRAGRRAQHRGPAGLHRRHAHPRRRLRRRGPGLGVDRGRRSTARTSPPASTRSSCSTASTAIDQPVVELAFTQASKPVVICGRRSSDGATGPRLPLPADAAPPAVLTRRPHARPDRTRPQERHAWTSDSSDSARWAATCAPACATPATPSSATTATPTSADVDSLAELVDAAALAPRSSG